MFRKWALSFFIAAIFAVSFQAVAQDGTAKTADQVIAESGGKDTAGTEKGQSAEGVKVEKPKEELTEDQLKRKVDLATKMHQIRPTAKQIDSAIESVAKRLPEQKREEFMGIMKESLNYNAIERISTDAMVEVFTLRELEVMVEYYSKPEAISSGEKMGDWAKIVQPEIAKLIDKALMKIRVGQ